MNATIEIDLLDSSQLSEVRRKVMSVLDNALDKELDMIKSNYPTYVENMLKDILKNKVEESIHLENVYAKKYFKRAQEFIGFIEDYNRKFVEVLSNGSHLKNVSLEFLKCDDNKTNAEDFVMKFYEENKKLIVKKFNYRYTCGYKANEITKNIDKGTSNVISSLLSDVRGQPDLIVLSDNIFFLIEVKNTGDGIRSQQMKWYLRHPEIPVRIVYVDRIINKGGCCSDECKDQYNTQSGEIE